MKKGLVYVLLTSIILIPIVSIIVVEILNQDDSTYTTYNVSYDYDDLETAAINIEETIQCKGIFSGVISKVNISESVISVDVMKMLFCHAYIMKGKREILNKGY